MVDTRPALSSRTMRRLHAALWIACIVVYTAMFASGTLAGGTDLFIMGKSMVATLVLAILGRVALGVLEKSRVPVRSAHEDNDLGSLLDLVSSPSDSADELSGASAPSAPAQEPVAVGAR